MMNSMDKTEMVTDLVDRFRVLADHRRVDLTTVDIERLRNLVDELLSKYVDDQHLVGDPNG